MFDFKNCSSNAHQGCCENNLTKGLYDLCQSDDLDIHSRSQLSKADLFTPKLCRAKNSNLRQTNCNPDTKVLSWHLVLYLQTSLFSVWGSFHQHSWKYLLLQQKLANSRQSIKQSAMWHFNFYSQTKTSLLWQIIFLKKVIAVEWVLL